MPDFTCETETGEIVSHVNRARTTFKSRANYAYKWNYCARNVEILM